MGVIAADQILIHLPKHYEIELILIDCLAPPESLPSTREGVAARINPAHIEARDQAGAMIAEAGKHVAAWIPQPARDDGWCRSLRPGTRHAGFLFLSPTETLNARLVSSGHCTLPRRRWHALTPGA
jgi:hypothetical protein